MTDERYSRLAAEHLPAELVERWAALLRPCVRLRRAGAGEAWPEWPGHGPLSFVASVRCGAPGCPETHLPRHSHGAGAQVLYIPESTPVVPADTPPELEAYPTPRRNSDRSSAHTGACARVPTTR